MDPVCKTYAELTHLVPQLSYTALSCLNTKSYPKVPEWFSCGYIFHDSVPFPEIHSQVWDRKRQCICYRIHSVSTLSPIDSGLFPEHAAEINQNQKAVTKVNNKNRGFLCSSNLRVVLWWIFQSWRPWLLIFSERKKVCVADNGTVLEDWLRLPVAGEQ